MKEMIKKFIKGFKELTNSSDKNYPDRFKDSYQSTVYKRTRHTGIDDFIEFGKRIGIIESRIQRLLDPFLLRQPLIEKLVKQSYLSNSIKKAYILEYNTRRNRLNAK